MRVRTKRPSATQPSTFSSANYRCTASACALVCALPSRTVGSIAARASCSASRSVAVVRTSPTFAPSSTRVRATLGEIPEMMQSHPISLVA
jgi:hypothetical protein